MKTYIFRINVFPAEFNGNVVSVSLSQTASGVLATEVIEATLRGAVARLEQLSAETPAPHMAALSMARCQDRKPPGFNNAKRVIYREGA